MPTDLLPHFLAAATHFKYVIVFIVAFLEGPILMIASGFLIHSGFFSLMPLFTSLVLGDLVGDVVWYYLGYFLLEPALRKHGKFMSITPELFDKSKELFHRYHKKILLISKMTMGFGMAIYTLMTAGAMRIPFRTYMKLNALGELVFVSIMISIGYFFGNLYGSIAHDFKIMFIVGILTIVILGLRGFVSYAKKRVTS